MNRSRLFAFGTAAAAIALPPLSRLAEAAAASILGAETTHVALPAHALGTRIYATGFVS